MKPWRKVYKAISLYLIINLKGGEKTRELTSEEIGKLASRAGVRKIAVENFLMSMGDDASAARANLGQDARDYKWNSATQKAIRDGISLASK